ncbi:hypothetical protein HPB52_011060 [Rhipicephalus sanguineus]|uniref:Uncharacterized protein n=1 Tax=Rhipicephalus sanguineus TaxID=34632 RepID=A0A9D4PMF2_RHISA|nr:hypothetical protein HPB52_011060 [Rhipicephalus sanguineus]
MSLDWSMPGAPFALYPQGKRPWRLNPRLLKDEEAAKDVAGLLCRSLLGGQDLGGSEWDAVKASVAECFREWGKRRAREERAEIKIVSDAILLLSKPLSSGPGLPRNKGGLEIPDLGIVATALHLRWTRVALESDMLLTRSFASFFLSTRLRLFSPEAFSNSVPRAGTPSPFYAGAASTLARLREANPGIELDSLELHDLVDLLTPDLPAHCVRYDLSRHSPNWKLSTASFLDAKRATFMYRLARGCLPITFRPFTKIPTRGKCPFCGSREDLVHIFSQCALPAALHQRIASLYGHPGVPFDTVRFLHPLPAQAVNQYVLLLVEPVENGMPFSMGGGRVFVKYLQKCGRRSGLSSTGNGSAWA